MASLTETSHCQMYFGRHLPSKNIYVFHTRTSRENGLYNHLSSIITYTQEYSNEENTL